MSSIRKRSKSASEVELRPDGWGRFEAAVGAAVKRGPQHRAARPSAKKAQKTAKKPRR